MKLPDFAEDELLNALRTAMGAPRRAFSHTTNHVPLSHEEIERLAREGLEIPLERVEILNDETLAYKGRRVVLYIRDVKQYRNTSIHDSDLPRFHVTNCNKLKEMRSNNRYERYVVATRETGIFRINVMQPNSRRYRELDRNLRVCQFCLDTLNWDNFSTNRLSRIARTAIVQAFTLEQYFSIYQKTFIPEVPQHTSDTAPKNDYTADFQKIAAAIKKKRGYQCEECEIDLTDNSRYLHAHHRNGLQYDNQESNIALLCIEHHANQPYHGHLKKAPEYWTFLKLKSDGHFKQR